VIREGVLNPNLLFVGTELGLYVSIDQGKSWTKYHKDHGFPTVRVDDLAIHPRELDLIVGTHGRSIWIVPIGALEQMTPKAMEANLFAFRPSTVYNLGWQAAPSWDGDGIFLSRNTATNLRLFYYLKAKPKEKVSIRVLDASGTEVTTVLVDGNAGLNLWSWSPFARLRGQGRARTAGALTGDLTAVIKSGDQEVRVPIRIEDMNQRELKTN
jgi:hypothetical protein